MNTVNALAVRQHFGQVLKTLEDFDEPILIEKGHTVQEAANQEEEETPEESRTEPSRNTSQDQEGVIPG